MTIKTLLADDSEHISMEVRKHWFVMLGHGLASLVLAVAPIFLYYLVFQWLPEILSFNFSWEDIVAAFPTSVDIPGIEFFKFLYLLWFLVIWILFFFNWTVFYLDVWYVTDTRIIAIDQKSMFHREAVSTYLERVQDVTIETRGLLQTLFDFGTIHVQTAGQASEMILKNARHPEEIKLAILEKYKNLKQRSRDSLE